MKKILISCILACCAPMLMSSSCNDKQAKNPCPADVVCTMMFKMITVEVKDAAGNNVTFDEFFTIRKSNQEIIRPDANNAMEGHFIVLDDSYVKKLANQQDSFRFIGIKNGKEVLSEPFAIGADCCHVNKISGREQITLP